MMPVLRSDSLCLAAPEPPEEAKKKLIGLAAAGK